MVPTIIKLEKGLMKYFVLFLFLYAGLNYSCKKDQQETDDRKLVLLETKLTQFGRSSINRYAFEYDSQGRVVKLNDEVFHYGANGRVDYSRVAVKEQHNGVSTARVTRLRYEWDEQNRLKKVVADSLYSSSTTAQGGISEGGNGYLFRDVLLSSYSYAGGSVVPDRIVYKKWDKPFGLIGSEEERLYSYGSGNIERLKQYMFNTPITGISGEYYMDFIAYSFYQYSNIIDPLYAVYTQMGFNPVDMNLVISKNLTSAFFSRIIEGKVDEEVQPDWTKKTKFEIVVGAGGRPTTTSCILKGDVETAKDVVFGQFVTTYIYQ